MIQGGSFTSKGQQALIKAQVSANQRNHPQVDALHLLESLLAQNDGIVNVTLTKIGVDIEDLKRKVQMALDKSVFNSEGNKVSGQLYLTPYLAKVLETSHQESLNMGDEFISIEHMFLAILDVEGRAQTILNSARIRVSSENNYSVLNYETFLEVLDSLRGDENITDPEISSKHQIIEKYARNLNDLAKLGKLDPVIGREKEIRRLMQVLSRRTKNNPVLIGEAGVGKTAIIEGLAQKIISGDIPESLKDKEIIALDLGAMIAGTRYRGEFENRIKSLMKEIKRAKDQYILFIDELHTLIGAGAAEGSIDASNLMKPALARGELRAIGATTLKEYQKYIEKDPALERRFQPIYTSEPTIEDTISILRGIKDKYELHHGVKIKDSALIASAELSARYITDRFLPDKAVDLMDEAMSSLRLEIESEPEELVALNKEIQKLEIEREAIKKEKTKTSEKRIKAINKQLANLQEKVKGLNAQWKSEREVVNTIKEIKKELEKSKFEVERAESSADNEKAAEIKYGTIPELMNRLKKAERKLVSFQKDRPILKEEVTEEEVASVISRWTGIPVSNLLEEEAKKLERMEKTLEKRVIGQKDALLAVSNAIRRSRAGISEENRPMGVFLFLGPTGVGKTETAKALAEFLFNNEDALVRLDMSEYMEKYSVSKLIGSAPGYVGHEEGGQLTDKVRRRPYSVILLDEIEKADRDVFNILLQIFEDGRLTDSKGRTASFKNTIIIMTSNVGSEEINRIGKLGFNDSDNEQEKDLKDRIMESLKEKFRPEFLNRIDEIVTFNHLSKEEIRKIVDLEINKVAKRLIKKNIKIDVSKEVKDELTKKGFDTNLGARPLKRVIQKTILDPLSLKIISREIKENSNVRVKLEKGQIVIKEKELVKA